MSLIFVLLAGIFGAAVNYCLRKNFEHQRSAQGYLSIYFIFSFLIALVLRFEINMQSFSWVMGSIGVVAGMLNLLMMFLVARALQLGPSGLTFAFQNSSSMFPALFLFFLFGRSFGFELHLPLIIGFCCLVLGLFHSSRKESLSKDPSRFATWALLAIAIFFVQGIILSIFQWRTLLLEVPKESHCLIPWTCSIQEDAWFMPGFFFVPAIVQTVIFYFSERRGLSSREIYLGTIAGILNGAATFCLLMATKDASESFRPILFPIFAVTVIFLCNLWGKRFYQEPIDWKGMSLCLAGVLIGSL